MTGIAGNEPLAMPQPNEQQMQEAVAETTFWPFFFLRLLRGTERIPAALPVPFATVRKAMGLFLWREREGGCSAWRRRRDGSASPCVTECAKCPGSNQKAVSSEPQGRGQNCRGEPVLGGRGGAGPVRAGHGVRGSAAAGGRGARRSTGLHGELCLLCRWPGAQEGELSSSLTRQLCQDSNSLLVLGRAELTPEVSLLQWVFESLSPTCFLFYLPPCYSLCSCWSPMFLSKLLISSKINKSHP